MTAHVSAPALPPAACTRENASKALCNMAVPFVHLVWLEDA